MPDKSPYKALMPMAAGELRMVSGAMVFSMPTTNLQAKMAMNKASGIQLPGKVKRWVAEL
jgi:hypothetical protein